MVLCYKQYRDADVDYPGFKRSEHPRKLASHFRPLGSPGAWSHRSRFKHAHGSSGMRRDDLLNFRPKTRLQSLFYRIQGPPDRFEKCPTALDHLSPCLGSDDMRIRIVFCSGNNGGMARKDSAGGSPDRNHYRDPRLLYLLLFWRRRGCESFKRRRYGRPFSHEKHRLERLSYHAWPHVDCITDFRIRRPGADVGLF